MSTLDNPIMDSQNEVSPWSTAVRYGGILGLVLIVLGLISYLLGFTDPANSTSGGAMLFNLLTFVVWIGGVVMAVKAYRGELGGFINFGKAFRVAFFTLLVTTVISTIWQFIFTSFIATDFYEIMLDTMRGAMEDQGADDGTIDSMMGIYEKIYTPGAFTILQLVGGAIFGAIIALIVGAILKKDPPQV